MKLLLLRLMALALVAASGVHALDDRKALRGFAENLAEAGKGSCEDGKKDGKQSVKKAWKKSGENCDNVWRLEDEANRMKDRKYRGDSSGSRSKSSKSSKGNSKKKSYNECAREGVDQQVKKIEKSCLEDDSGQCTDLGEAAAEIIVKDEHCSPGGQGTHSHSTNYKKECKKAATAACEGQVSTVAKRWCKNKSLKTSKLREMQKKCKKQVSKMVDGGGDLGFVAWTFLPV